MVHSQAGGLGRMMQKKLFHTCQITLITLFCAALFSFANISCGNNTAKEKSDSRARTPVGFIEDEEQFKNIIDSAGNRLLVFDFYADWCPPCKILSPILEEIAKENGDKAAFYKINIDQNQFLARTFRVTGIPFVVFFKNKTTVHALPGVRSKDTYVKIINHFSHIAEEIRSNTPANTAGSA